MFFYFEKKNLLHLRGVFISIKMIRLNKLYLYIYCCIHKIINFIIFFNFNNVLNIFALLLELLLDHLLSQTAFRQASDGDEGLYIRCL